jgi:hypothetical protein
MYSSTCFGHPQTHHQELNNYSSSLWLYRWSVVVAVLLVVVGPIDPTTTNSTATVYTLYSAVETHRQRLDNISSHTTKLTTSM